MLDNNVSSCVVFSDNEDELRIHSEMLDSVHDSIFRQDFQLISSLETTSASGLEKEMSTDNENDKSYFDKDPVFRRLLRDKRRPLQDVFIRSMEPPPKTLNEYEFKMECGTHVFPVKTNQEGFLFYRSGNPGNVNSPSLCTPQTIKRRRSRLLRRALIELASPMKRNDDEEYIPMTPWNRTVEESEFATPTTRKLRPRKREWTSDDDLPLDALRLKLNSDKLKKHKGVKCSPSDEKHTIPNRKSRKRVLTSISDSDDELLCAYTLKHPKIQLKRVRWPIKEPKAKRTRIKYNDKGSKSCKEEVHELTKCSTNSSKRRSSTEPVAKKLRILNQADDDWSESDMDIPLSNFLTPKTTRRKTPLRLCRIFRS